MTLPDYGTFDWAVAAAGRRVAALRVRAVIYWRARERTYGVCTQITFDRWMADDPTTADRITPIATMDVRGALDMLARRAASE